MYLRPSKLNIDFMPLDNNTMTSNTQVFKPSITMKQLTKHLWKGLFVYQVVFLLVVAIRYPGFLKLAFVGCLMGVFYLWSLLQSADRPKKKGQSMMSLLRVAALAYCIVHLTQVKIPEITIVMLGLLSYKMVLAIEYFAQGRRALVACLVKGKSKKT